MRRNRTTPKKMTLVPTSWPDGQRLGSASRAAPAGRAPGLPLQRQERPDDKQPSAQTSYTVAWALGVAVSDLPVRSFTSPEFAESLRQLSNPPETFERLMELQPGATPDL